ncbi:MFS transporter, partial [Streptomyces synnematoformans]|uniref:MFS transporter n=1 Tax=Streptomyces synnematoformans TaxID=415721 RepID=UPI0031DF4A69
MVLALCCLAQLMVVLDVSVVNVALPSIEADLGFAAAGLPWVVNGYALVFAGFLLLGGRLADVCGHRRVFLLGLGLFTAASLAGGLAASPGLLVAARAAQGLGAAVLAPATLTVLTAAFPEGAGRTRAVAVWTAAGSAGGTAGNLVGGLLTEALSWRWILLINVPVGVAALVAAARLLPGTRPHGRRRPRLDLPGAALATAGLLALAYGIARSGTSGWSSPRTALSLVLGLGVLAGFVALQARPAAGRTPLLPLRLFRARAIWLGNVLMLLAGASLTPMWYFLSLSMQHVLGYGPLETGLGFLPHTVLGVLVGVRLTPWAMRHVGARPLVAAGALTAAAGFLWQSRATEASTYWSGVFGPAVVMTLGSALFIAPLTTVVVSGIAPADAGAAAGVMNTVKQVGSGLGLAVLVAVAAPGGGTPAALAAAYAHAFAAMAALLAVVAGLAAALSRGAG